MADKTVYVKVGAKVDGAVTGLQKVRRSLDDLAKADLKKPQKSLEQLSTKAATVDRPVAGVRKLKGSLDSLGRADLKKAQKSLEQLSDKATNVERPVSGLRKFKRSFDELSKADLKKPKAAFDELSTKAAVVGGVVALGIGKAVSSFADFDQAMSAVGANSGAAGAQLDALRDQAIKLGSETSFSATEAAQGINELAKAGVSVGEIMNGGLKGALDLAAAGQIGVAEAAETTASALNQFELKGDKATHVADLLANAANAAQGGVGDMGQALGQAGVAAHASGLDIDETTTLLGLFAKAGMTGSDAGTSLKTMMQRLSAPTEKAAGTLEELGVAAYDAQGNFVGAESLITQLSEATKDMSTESKMAAFNVIFGADAIRAASIAAAAGTDGYKAMNAQVTKVGGAAENAAKLTDNFKGDLERLGGSLETTFITGGASANTALRTLTQGLGGLVDKVGAVPGPVLLAGAAFASIALTLPKGISVYKDFKGSLDTLGISMDKLTTKAPRTASALRGIGKAAGALAIAATAVYAFSTATDKINSDKLGADLTMTSDGLGLINKELAGQTDNGWGRVGSDIDSFGKILGATFDPGIVNNIDDTIGSLKTVFGGENVSNISNAAKQLQGIDQAMSALVAGGNVDKAKALFAQMSKVAQDQGISIEELQRKFPLYAAALAHASSDAAGAKGELKGLNGELDTTPGSAASAERGLSDLKGGLNDVETSAKDAATELSDLLELADSMAGGKRSLAADRAGLEDAGDAAIKAAKNKGGDDTDAIKAQAQAKQDLADAKAALAKGNKGSAKDVAALQKRVAERQDDLAKANERVADSFVAPAKAQRDYEASMRSIGDAGDQLIDNLIKQGKPVGELNKAYDDQRAKLIAAANARGIHGKAAETEADKVSKTVEQMNDLRFQYVHTQKYVDTQVRTPGLPKAKAGIEGYWEVINGVPKFHETKLTTPGLASTKAGVKGYWTVIDGVPTFKKTTFEAVTSSAKARIADIKAELAGIPRTITTIMRVRSLQNELKLEANGVNTNRAAGGPIVGAGTGTSDTAGLFALSNGEHVLTAAEVAAAGGHGAILALRKAILSGGVQYRATGGPATAPRAYRSAPAATRGPRLTASEADLVGQALARHMGPQIGAVYGGPDTLTAVRQGLRDYDWQVGR